jgi:hypothetical protein
MDRCLVCRADFDAVHICRLVYEEPDDWVEVAICTASWRTAERRHQARLRERERRLLNEWFRPQKQEAQP